MAKAGRGLDQHNASEGRHVTQPQPYHKCASSWQENLAERCSVAETEYLTARFKLIEYDDPPIIERPVVKTRSRRAKPKPAHAPDLPPLSKSAFPTYRTAAELAGPVFPVSKQVILATARRHRIGRKMGRVILFSPDDCQRLYQELVPPCRSNSSPPAKQKPKAYSSAAHTSESVWTRAAELTNDPSLSKSSSKSKPQSSVANTRKPRLIVDKN
jgi:hypothetical protein